MTMVQARASFKNILTEGTLQLSITGQRQGLLLDVTQYNEHDELTTLYHICMLSIKELQSCSIQQWESSTVHITVTGENAAANQLHFTVKP